MARVNIPEPTAAVYQRYIGEVVGRSAETGDPETIKYDIVLFQENDRSRSVSLMNHAPRLRSFRNVIVEAAEVGSPAEGWMLPTGWWVRVFETVRFDEHCTGGAPPGVAPDA